MARAKVTYIIKYKGEKSFFGGENDEMSKLNISCLVHILRVSFLTRKSNFMLTLQVDVSNFTCISYGVFL